MQQVYGDSAFSCSVVLRWYRRFSKERRSWRIMCVLVGHKPFELNARLVAISARANRSQSVDDLAATVGISYGKHYKMLTDDLNLSRVTHHSVSSILNPDQRDNCMKISGDLISDADDVPTFLNRIVTGDETWCILYDPHLKRQSATWRTPISSRQKNLRKTGQKAR